MTGSAKNKIHLENGLVENFSAIAIFIIWCFMNLSIKLTWFNN